MTTHHDNHSTFHCPECASSREEADLFCSPFTCPDQIPQPRFPSPTSPSSLEDAERLHTCIEEVNSLLLAAGEKGDQENFRALQLRFRKLRGQFVRAAINNDHQHNKKEIIGALIEAGRDFILIDDLKKKTFIPLRHIQSVTHHNLAAHEFGNQQRGHGHTQELISIDRCHRRELVLNFGEFVSCNPFLINLFFGIPLHVYLAAFVECKIMVRQINGDIVRGTLAGSDEHYLHVKAKENTIKPVNLSEVSFIEIR